MVELRKRKDPPQPAPPPPARKRSSNPVKSDIEKDKAAATDETKPSASSKNASTGGFPTVGSSIDLEGFGGEIENNDGEKTNLKQLAEDSTGGVVLFTYPKASTPGCTKQACLFRDDYTSLTATGFSIFGLSRDSPKSNTTFKTKQNLPYTLLCDQSGTLITAIGLGQKKGSTTRGVFVVDKSGKVLAAEAGGPEPTVQVVKKLVAAGDHSAAPVTATESGDPPTNGKASEKDITQAETAAQVADNAVAAKIDVATPQRN